MNSQKFSQRAYAKVNLVLDVLEKTASGYHSIQTILHQVTSLYDELSFEKGGAGVTYFCRDPRLEFDEKNTIVRAVSLFEKAFSKKVGGHFSLTKRIPLRSGLGGGSSDAAATLKLLVRAYDVHCCVLDTPAGVVDSCHDLDCPLFKIAREIGMDVPFFINGGTQLATHFGEKLMPLMSVAPYFDFEIINTGREVLTVEAYNALNLAECGKNIDKTHEFLAALSDGDAQKMLDAMHNDFDAVPQGAPENLNHPNSEKILLAGSGGAKARILTKDII